MYSNYRKTKYSARYLHEYFYIHDTIWKENMNITKASLLNNNSNVLLTSLDK